MRLRSRRVPRPTYVYAGSCGNLNEVLWPLNSLISPNGTDGGSPDSDRTEYSFTANVPLTITAMLSGNYAINVAESAESPERVLTCGNVGGVPDSIGTLVIGLRGQAGSDITGIAVLAPSPSDPAMTFISVFVTGGALGDEVGTIGVEQPIVNVPGEDTADDDQAADEIDDGDDNGNDGEDDQPDDNGDDGETDDDQADDSGDDNSGSDNTESDEDESGA